MLFPKHQSQFSRDAVYFVVIEKHNEHSPSIGFFHHRKHETGFLAYAVFSTEIQTVKLERRLTKDFAVSHFVKLADFPYSAEYRGIYCPTHTGSMVIETNSWMRDVLLGLDHQRKEGRLTWQHDHDSMNILNRLRTFAPEAFVLLTSLLVFARP